MMSKLHNSNALIARNTQVVLIEDSETDFFIIKKMLEQIGCKLVLGYEEVLTLIANYHAYRKVEETYSQVFKQCVDEQIHQIISDRSVVWILDVCWVLQPTHSSPDRFGIDFMKEYRPSNPILISLSPYDAYAHQISDVRFICKSNSLGESLTNQFAKEMADSIAHFSVNSNQNQNSDELFKTF